MTLVQLFFCFQTVLNPQHDFYYKLAEECVAAGCAVDLFLFPSAYMDIASIAPLSRHTGGQIYKYTYFQVSFFSYFWNKLGEICDFAEKLTGMIILLAA